MKKYLYTAFIAAFITLILITGYQINLSSKYKNLYDRELQNVKAYQSANSNLEDNILEYQMSMQELQNSKDSIDRKLVAALEELHIKPNSVEYLQLNTQTIHTTDTIQLSDTVFVPQLYIDTIIGDQWYNLDLTLVYPSTIIASPTFNTEQYVIINSKKEYINKPSKWFFIRWFQKKQKVVEVNVEEKSPYVKTKEQKYIKIIK